MKHVLLISAVLLSATTNGVCQGVVTFANSNLPDQPRRLVRGSDGSPLVGTQWAVQLYYGASAASLAAHTAAPQRFRATTTTSPGTWTTTGATRTLNGGGVGVPLWMQVRLWNLDQFPTYEAALAGGGPGAFSSVFQYVQRLSSPPDPIDTYMLNFDGFTALNIPEPGALLLAGPALAVLLCVRRGIRRQTRL